VRLLIDAHSILWAADDPTRLSPTATTLLQDPSNELFLSAGTMWEIAVKVGLNKLTLTMPIGQWLIQAIADLDISLVPITVDHAAAYVALPFHHRDPFDRLMLAQAITDGMSIVSADSGLDAYGVKRLW
jgi:PIN domain nuclease of toxin-antitoxin system